MRQDLELLGIRERDVTRTKRISGAGLEKFWPLISDAFVNNNAVDGKELKEKMMKKKSTRDFVPFSKSFF